ncbi:kinase-like domain-containing protein [Aspergillus parasiticus]|uniref:Kinase-like domain-containing protein n=1 Tax=Aspergillus parasiticus TaxID=5067 RepID=A0A5N6DLP4_ASPPA|nr:kinase-like domain-containing protein [Aspergillus parasiticus]
MKINATGFNIAQGDMGGDGACSWASTRQEECLYNSHVKLFYGVSNRGNIDTSSQSRQEDDGTCFLLTKRIQGRPLSEAWPTMSETDKERVAKQTAEYVTQLRELQSSKLESLGGQQLYSAFLFPNGYGIGHGPFSSDDELWAEMSLSLSLSLSNVPEEIRSQLRQRMPSAAPYTFTHGDFTNVNIMVHNGNLSGILDWESSGYFPVWWELTAAGISLGKDDKEWKELLRRYLPDHTEARNFLVRFLRIAQIPKCGRERNTLFEELWIEPAKSGMRIEPLH